MATTNNTTAQTYEAGADLSASHFFLVKVGTVENQVVLSGAGEDSVGVLVEPASAAGRPVAVEASGKVRAYAGGTVAIGARVASDANGAVVTAVAGDYVLGTAVTAGADGAMMEFNFDKNGVEPA